MRFLTDVNVGSRIASALTANGHDVVRMIHIDPKATDSQILDIAASEERILITYDRDFSELVFARLAAPPSAIIYLRYPSWEVEAALAHLLSVLDFELLNQNLTVIDKRHVRHSPFPKRQTGPQDME